MEIGEYKLRTIDNETEYETHIEMKIHIFEQVGLFLQRDVNIVFICNELNLVHVHIPSFYGIS